MAGIAKSSLEKRAAQKQADQQYRNDTATAEQQHIYNKEMAAQQYANEQQALAQQRAWDIEDRDESRAYSRQVLKHLVEDADAAGINPIAVINGGGASSYNAAAGFAPLSRTAPVLQAVGKTAVSRQAVGGSPLAAGIGAGAETFLQTFDPFANERRNESYRIVGSAIATRNAASLSRVPPGAASIARGAVVPSKPLVSRGLGSPTAPEAGDTNVTNPFETLDVDPNARDAAAYEERYGELLSNVGGAINLGRDWFYNVSKRLSPAFNAVRRSTTSPAAGWIESQIRNNPGFRPPKLAKGGGLRQW